MTEKREWKRPDQVETFRTSDPKKMFGKFLPKNVLKTWTEDFIDEDTKEVVSIERNQVIVQAGEITQEKLQEIQFAIQAGDIEDVEVATTMEAATTTLRGNLKSRNHGFHGFNGFTERQTTTACRSSFNKQKEL